MAASRRRVVLHFDLNRTVLMSDAAGGRSMENTVNYLLSECTWGRVADDAAQWHCVSTASTVDAPAAATGDAPLVTYKQFVDDLLPYQSLKDAADDLDQVKAFNRAAKKQRTALQSAFTETGSPGEAVAHSFQEVMHKLHFPEGKEREAAQRAAATLPPSRLQEAWSEGRYYLLPSFLKFLEHVASVNASSNAAYDIKLVFRTFGDDIPEVAKELELLVDGKHPFQLSAPLPTSFKLVPSGDQVGTFYRDGFNADGTALAVGSLTKVPFTKANQGDASALQAFYAAQGQSVDIVRGFQGIKTRLDEMVSKHSTLALRDYWEWWSAHAEDGEYGKLLLVDAAAAAPSDDISVFFDDHIEAHHAHIVDVRNVASGAPVAFSESKHRKFLQRVEPFAAITDEQYFVKLVQNILL